jgi:hypothetical protein
VPSYRAETMSQPWPDPIADEEALHPTDIVRVMLQEAGTLSRLIEIHYFSQEPGFLNILRGLGALADEDRATLDDYLHRHSGKDLSVRELPNGALMIAVKRESPDGTSYISKA